ncbi:MAG TPA: PDDEXK nuclease domain-containing protein [Gammaproteobacteria bacterium]|nr:PDDEXK nuclease domain-containing protein [Gammaproteobacteria bacterium]
MPAGKDQFFWRGCQLESNKDRLKTAQIKAALAVNSEQIRFYWELGYALLEKQKIHKWGDSFLVQFSHDIRAANPGMQGFSVFNLKRMRRFAIHYPITHVRNFLIELGQGFAFVGSQVPISIDDQEFFIDLLFYHLHLRCFIVVELKANNFKPEYTGQLGFYLAAVDDLMKKESDNPTIGILLCKSKNKIVAEYALRGMKAPIGISEYVLSKAVPNELKSSLPTVEQMENLLNEMCEEREI